MDLSSRNTGATRPSASCNRATHLLPSRHSEVGHSGGVTGRYVSYGAPSACTACMEGREGSVALSKPNRARCSSLSPASAERLLLRRMLTKPVVSATI